MRQHCSVVPIIQVQLTTLAECNNDLSIFAQLFRTNVQRELHSGTALGPDKVRKIFFKLLQLQSEVCTQIATQEDEWGMEYHRGYSFGDFETMIEAMSKEVVINILEIHLGIDWYWTYFS
jgi:hypothetical protein